MFAIFKREMRSYFTSPVGYMFCAIFFAVSGFLFMLNTVQAGEESNYAGYFSIILFLFIVIIPLLTMKLVSEETKMKTDQLLMTAPITLADIVFGKFLAALTMFGGSFIISSVIYYIPRLIPTQEFYCRRSNALSVLHLYYMLPAQYRYRSYTAL